MNPSQVIVHIVTPSEIPDGIRDLTPDEIDRASAFRFPKDREHWTACRAALRRILSEVCGVPPNEVPILINPNGKPELTPPSDGMHFNLSHCDNLAVIAIAASPVGVDVEPWSRANELLGCEDSFCHPDEIQKLPGEPTARAASLLTLWTAKEALLKALGTGFLHPPTGVSIDPTRGSATSDIPIDGIDRQRIIRLDHPRLADHSAFVALAIPAPEIVIRMGFH